MGCAVVCERKTMSIDKQTMKCPICGRPYAVYAMTVADQSACPACVREGERAVQRPDTPQENRRRNEYFNK